MFERLRQSLALRLAGQYALVFALALALIFSALYWLLANAFDARERAALELSVADMADAFANGGPEGINSRVVSDSSPEMRSLFVRLTRPDGTIAYNKWPEDWVETRVQQLIPGVSVEHEILRIPQNAGRDYTIESRQLPGGWTLHVGRLLDSKAVFLAPLRRAFAGVGAAALLLSLGLGTLLAWRATRPLRFVSATARHILETGELDARVPVPGGSGELTVLVQQINRLLDKDAAHVRVLRETLDNLAHDLRTPLTRLRASAELALGEGGNPADARTALADCIDESDRLLHLLEALLDVSAAEASALKLNRTRIDLRSLAGRAADLYREVAEEKGISVTLDQPSPVVAEVDAVRLGQVVNNLLDNALKYSPAGARVTLTVRSEAGAAVLAVADTGPGVPEGEREAVFRRLYRSEACRSQRGIGLGLSLVKAIVESHGGSVAVDEPQGGGARFTVRLPY
jgi:signal transduction histidine kinase